MPHTRPDDGRLGPVAAIRCRRSGWRSRSYWPASALRDPRGTEESWSALRYDQHCDVRHTSLNHTAPMCHIRCL